VGCNIKYKYIGETGFILVLDSQSIKLRKGQVLEFDENKLKTRKMKQLFVEVN